MSNFSRDDIRSFVHPCLSFLYISSILDRSESHPRLWNFAVGNRMHRLPIFLRDDASLWIFLHLPHFALPLAISADLFARHAYSSLKLFALSTFSPCTLIHRFAFRNGFARETSPPMNARTPVALTDSFILVYLCPGFFLPFFILRDLTYETIIIFFDL